jgi:tight adherence protein C
MNPLDLFGPGQATENLIITLAVIGVFVDVLLLYRVMLERDPRDARVKEMKARMQELKDGISAPRRRDARREASIGVMKTVVDGLNLLRTRQGEKAQRALACAGWRSRDALSIYFFLKLSLPFVFGVAALFVLFVAKTGVEMPMSSRLLVALLAVVAGAYGPDLYVRNTASKRGKIIQKGLPDALDLMVICAEAGQSIDAALGRVAKELHATCPPLADELQLTAIELGLLPERRQALANLNNRTNLPSIRGIVNTLQQSEKYGTPLSMSLRVLATEFRNDRMMKAEAKAARLPAILTVPMIVFILPPLFIVLIGPAIISTIDNLSRL